MNIKKKYYQLKKHLFPSYFTSENMVNYLKEMGIQIGKHVRFYRPTSIIIDETRPCLLKIGDYCKLTSGVIILTHDYSRSVLRRVYGEIIGEAKPTVIGKNVFIGMNSIILMGSRIGDNVIIGAGSVVSRNVPDNSVVAGNPAHVIMTLEEFYKKRKAQYVDEAKEYTILFKEKYRRAPNINELGAFFPLFFPRDREALINKQIFTNLGGDNQSEIIDDFMKTSPLFIDYDSFISYALSIDK